MEQPPNIVQRNISLASYTTLQIGGPATYFALPSSIEELSDVVRWATMEHVPFRLIGRGANLLVSDAGYDGLAIVMKNDTLEWEGSSVIAGAGVQNGQLIASALKHHLGGMRWLIGVPGTVGGSLYGNAGGHGWGLGDQVEWVDIVTSTGTRQRLSKQECAFDYRTSVFKQHPDWIIVQARFTFPTVDAVAERLLLAETTKQKNANQPTTEKTAGCMFTNPVVSDLSRLSAELRTFVAPDGTLSAWRCIEAVGLKGQTIGHIQISPKHANFMINLGGGTADEVMQLMSYVKQQVRDTLGIQLHEEVQYLGF